NVHGLKRTIRSVAGKKDLGQLGRYGRRLPGSIEHFSGLGGPVFSKQCRSLGRSSFQRQARRGNLVEDGHCCGELAARYKQASKLDLGPHVIGRGLDYVLIDGERVIRLVLRDQGASEVAARDQRLGIQLKNAAEQGFGLGIALLTSTDYTQ